eukprot:CAMPEP_0175122826 /NCGR_PEP_ID=MMETSP0087-20121206/1919_1 /TAXON_ID=136419 /ORGANISM="Unknown Unknown, Strain D1" /LENGTH=540 /DNA_ID=CAMNT_0016404481 /DNA_START=30 /DNA_END=1650 /DNA_ORIENTATION=+
MDFVRKVTGLQPSVHSETGFESTAQRLRAEASTDEKTYNSEHRLRAENLAWDIDVWYRRLAPYTFESVFLPLSLPEAAAIVHSYDVNWRGKPLTTLTRDDVFVLQRLENRIDEALKSSFQTPRESTGDASSAFMDFVVAHRKTEAQLASVAYTTNTSVGNEKLIAVARTPTLKVDSGAAAMSLLLSSERVFTDVVDWLKYGEPEQIVLRKWEARLLLEYEFRCFVWKGKITAISQYDHYCVYPHLAAQQLAIKNAITAHWRKFHHAVGQESYCADLVYFPDTKKAMLVEISPFLPCTGPAMFSWVTDIRVLHGEDPFEFRLNNTIRPQIEDLVEAQWEDRWCSSNREHPLPYDHYWATVLENGTKWEELAKQLVGQHKQKFLVACAAGLATTGCSRLMGSKMFGASLVACSSMLAALLWQTFFPLQKNDSEVLFVYGTLQRGFHWHDKFLAGAEYLGLAQSATPLPLVVGECGVPYVLGDLPSGSGKLIRGELWQVSSIALRGMDSYEGCSKGYYERRKLRFRLFRGERGKTLGISEQAW